MPSLLAVLARCRWELASATGRGGGGSDEERKVAGRGRRQGEGGDDGRQFGGGAASWRFEEGSTDTGDQQNQIIGGSKMNNAPFSKIKGFK